MRVGPPSVDPGPATAARQQLRWLAPSLLHAGKTAVASGLAWYLAANVLGNQIPVFAPLAALLTVQVTVWESVSRGLQRVLGVFVGVIVSFAFARLAGIHWWSIALVIFVSLLAGQALRLGPQGSIQVPVSALLVLVLGATTGGYALDRVVDTALGAALGIVVNLVVVPPTHLPRSQAEVRQFGLSLAASLREVAGDMRRLDRVGFTVAPGQTTGGRLRAGAEQTSADVRPAGGRPAGDRPAGGGNAAGAEQTSTDRPAGDRPAGGGQPAGAGNTAAGDRPAGGGQPAGAAPDPLSPAPDPLSPALDRLSPAPDPLSPALDPLSPAPGEQAVTAAETSPAHRATAPADVEPGELSTEEVAAQLARARRLSKQASEAAAAVQRTALAARWNPTGRRDQPAVDKLKATMNTLALVERPARGMARTFADAVATAAGRVRLAHSLGHGQAGAAVPEGSPLPAPVASSLADLIESVAAYLEAWSAWATTWPAPGPAPQPPGIAQLYHRALLVTRSPELAPELAAIAATIAVDAHRISTEISIGTEAPGTDASGTPSLVSWRSLIG